MEEEKRDHVQGLTSVAIVAPIWLQNALLVYLHSAPELKLVACTATVPILLALDLQQIPDLIILEADKKSENAQNQVKRLKISWPASHIIALIQHSSQAALVQAAGAAEILLSGTAPEELMRAISRLRGIDKETTTDPLEESKA